MKQTLIQTSEPGWMTRLATAYKNQTPVIIVDDAGVGIDPQRQTILGMGQTAGLSASDWSAVLVALGLSAVGVWMIVAAIVDPEPTSKLGLLIGGGVVAVIGGGTTAVSVLTKRKPPRVAVSGKGFEIGWDE
jgi:hypothetical protein